MDRMYRLFISVPFKTLLSGGKLRLVLIVQVLLMLTSVVASQQISRTKAVSYTKRISLGGKLGEEKKHIKPEDMYAPVIRFLNPELTNNQAVSIKKVFAVKGLTYSKDGSSIQRFLLNDEEVEISNDDTFEYPLVLAKGNNQFVFTSITEKNNTIQDTLFITYTPPKARNFLFKIAINNYQHWPELNNPMTNANGMTKVLQERYGFNKENVYSLENEAATSEKIYKKFKDIIGELNEYDNLIIFFSGHGHYDEVLQEGYWIPYEAKKNSPSGYISNSELISLLRAIKTKHTLLISDACFAGSLFENNYRGKTFTEYSNYDKRKSRWAFTSGSLERVTDKSLFAESIIQFLEKNQKAEVLTTELSEFVINRVGSNSSQMPVIAPIKFVDHEGGQFIFRLNEK